LGKGERLHRGNQGTSRSRRIRVGGGGGSFGDVPHNEKKGPCSIAGKRKGKEVISSGR